MSDSMAGTASTCVYHTRMLSVHGEQLKAIGPRIESIEKNMAQVREKLFNGYGDQLKHTNEKMDEIKVIFTELSERGSLDETEIINIVERCLMLNEEKRRKAEADNRKWFRTHRIEILSVFVAVCMALLTVVRLVGV